MEFNKSFFQEEIRSDFLVTEKRKRIWAAELCILEKFDEICQRHQLTYYVYYGTLLGAVRHQGFIPWDDDIDVVMFRDDYEKFQEIAPKEFTEPYFFQNAYTDELIRAFSKIRDSRTSAIEFTSPDLRGFHQGIFMDIFPLDCVCDKDDLQSMVTAEIQRLLWLGITDPWAILNDLKQGKTFILERDFLLDFMRKSPKERFRLFETYNLSRLNETQEVNYILSEICNDGYKCVHKDLFSNIIYLPFENLRVPAPSEYDKILTQCYGDYHKPVKGGSAHENVIMDPDISYIKYFSDQG